MYRDEIDKIVHCCFAILDDLSAKIREEAKKWQGEALPPDNRYTRFRGKRLRYEKMDGWCLYDVCAWCITVA